MTSLFVHQFHTACLAEFAYYIESNGEAAIIDPLREIKPYLEMAQSRNAKIKYIMETHFHADFVSGHNDLAKATGAKIIYGPTAKADYEIYCAKDEEELPLGDAVIKVLHTPGHTFESSCYLLIDENKKPHCVFTGDTLFLGEVGRPDLAARSDFTKEDLAGLMYDSLRNKVMTLSDDIIVYPAHGAGSACGKNISTGKSCTIGKQKETNYALQPMTKEDFISIVASNIQKPPKYFFHASAMNKTNFTNLDDLLKNNLKPLTVDQVKELIAQGAIVIDSRDVPVCQSTGIIPGSVAISLSTPFAIWAGTLLNPQDRVIVVAEPGREEEAVVRLARVGLEHCEGFLKGGIQEWMGHNEPLDKIVVKDTNEHFEDVKTNPEIRVVDVRNVPEWEVGVYPGSDRIPLGQLEGRYSELDKIKPYHILCKSGIRATIAYSLLKRQGFDNLSVMKGGADELIKIGFKLDQIPAN